MLYTVYIHLYTVYIINFLYMVKTSKKITWRKSMRRSFTGVEILWDVLSGSLPVLFVSHTVICKISSFFLQTSNFQWIWLQRRIVWNHCYVSKEDTEIWYEEITEIIIITTTDIVLTLCITCTCIHEVEWGCKRLQLFAVICSVQSGKIKVWLEK